MGVDLFFTHGALLEAVALIASSAHLSIVPDHDSRSARASRRSAVLNPIIPYLA
jgi:hypothetical protein